MRASGLQLGSKTIQNPCKATGNTEKRRPPLRDLGPTSRVLTVAHIMTAPRHWQLHFPAPQSYWGYYCTCLSYPSSWAMIWTKVPQQGDRRQHTTSTKTECLSGKASPSTNCVAQRLPPHAPCGCAVSAGCPLRSSFATKHIYVRLSEVTRELMRHRWQQLPHDLKARQRA